jgi:capsular exopolysaccharide synthesis family protein
MTSIDRALRAWEAANGGATADRSPASPAATTLQQYQPERLDSTDSVVASPAPAEAPIAPAQTASSDARAERNRRRGVEHRSRLVSHAVDSVSLEQYRRLAAALHDEQLHRGFKSVMVTSALPKDGKTLTIVNLALTLSESYARRVLVVDADLRNPSVHSLFRVPNTSGLAEALHDARERPLAFVQINSHLSVLPAGRPGRSPLAGLTSGRMKEVIEDCERAFDWVLIDTPPVGVLTDAQVLADLVGALVFVVGAGSTPMAAVERAIAEVGGPDAITGIVLNRMDQRRIPQADYYGHYAPAEA